MSIYSSQALLFLHVVLHHFTGEERDAGRLPVTAKAQIFQVGEQFFWVPSPSPCTQQALSKQSLNMCLYPFQTRVWKPCIYLGAYSQSVHERNLLN